MWRPSPTIYFVCLVGLPLLSGGCLDDVISEATAPHTDPGGTVQASEVTGEERTTTALANATAEPMTIQGASSELTFSLTAADTVGGTAITDLAQANTATSLTIYPGGRNTLEIHLDGGGCLASTGTVHLSIDDASHIAGDFIITGTVSGGTAACQASGTLTAVPEEH